MRLYILHGFLAERERPSPQTLDESLARFQSFRTAKLAKHLRDNATGGLASVSFLFLLSISFPFHVAGLQQTATVPFLLGSGGPLSDTIHPP